MDHAGSVIWASESGEEEVKSSVSEGGVLHKMFLGFMEVDEDKVVVAAEVQVLVVGPENVEMVKAAVVESQGYMEVAK
jgi:hypothetical protein